MVLWLPPLALIIFSNFFFPMTLQVLFVVLLLLTLPTSSCSLLFFFKFSALCLSSILDEKIKNFL